MILESATFTGGSRMPDVHLKEKQNQNPSMTWREAPEGTCQFILMCENPQGDNGIFTHWLVYNIPAETTGLPSNMDRTETVQLHAEITHGLNDLGTYGWEGPLPSGTEMNYFVFRLFALSECLDLRPALIKSEVLEAIEGKILETAELMCTCTWMDPYEKKNPYVWGRIS